MKFKTLSLSVTLPENFSPNDALRVENVLLNITKGLGYSGNVSYMTFEDYTSVKSANEKSSLDVPSSS